MLQTSVGEALKKADQVVSEALALPVSQGAASQVSQVAQAKARLKEEQSGPYKHLLTGVSFMLPLVVAGGLIIALSFVFGIEAFKQEGTLPAALMRIGGQGAFALMVPVLAGYIAFSIADRPGLAPGLVGGMLATQLNAGFLGGIAAGFLAGYVARWLRDHVRLPATLEGLKPVLIIPLVSTLVVGLLMIYVVGKPVGAIMVALTEFLKGMSGRNAVVLGAVLGGDDGARHGRAGQQGGVRLLGRVARLRHLHAHGRDDGGGDDAAAGARAGHALVARNRFTLQEREAGKATAVLGIAFITEGAIPFAAKDPLRVIPALMLGSAVAGAMSMGFGCGLRAPHGGVFVLAIPNAAWPLGFYVLSIAAGTVVTALGVMVLKKPLAED